MYNSSSSSACQKYLTTSLRPKGSLGVICFKSLKTLKYSCILSYFIPSLSLYSSNFSNSSSRKNLSEYFSLTDFISLISLSSIFSWISSTNKSAKATLFLKSISLSCSISITIFLLWSNSIKSCAFISLYELTTSSFSLNSKVTFLSLLSIILAASGHESDIPISLREPNSSVYLGYCWHV